MAHQEPDKSYNIGKDAEAPARGIKKPDGFGEKMSKLLKGRKQSQETCENISKGHIGLKHSKEWRKNQSKSLTGLKRTPETCERIRQSQLGKKYTEEQCRAISKRLIGNTHTQDKTIYTFKHRITNEIFTGIKSDFYKKYKLDKSTVCNLVKGKRNTTQIRGWILLNIPVNSIPEQVFSFD